MTILFCRNMMISDIRSLNLISEDQNRIDKQHNQTDLFLVT